MELRHTAEINEELSGYGLEQSDLTSEELEALDNAIDVEENGGLVLDGIRSALPDKAYRKCATGKNNVQ